MRVDIRILKVLHRGEGHHVRKPAERPVRGAGPYADPTETNLQQRTYGTRQHVARNFALHSNKTHACRPLPQLNSKQRLCNMRGRKENTGSIEVIIP